MRRSQTVGAALVALALALGACGGDDDEEQPASAPPAESTPAEETPAANGGGGEKLALEADPSGAPKFDKTELTTKAGTVTIDLANPSSAPHAIEVEGESSGKAIEEEGETVTKGGTSTVTVDLEPGTYEFYCPVGNHADAGMKGTLTVE